MAVCPKCKKSPCQCKKSTYSSNNSTRRDSDYSSTWSPSTWSPSSSDSFGGGSSNGGGSSSDW